MDKIIKNRDRQTDRQTDVLVWPVTVPLTPPPRIPESAQADISALVWNLKGKKHQ